MTWFEWKMQVFDVFNNASAFVALCLAVTSRNLKSGSRAPSGSVRLISRCDNLSVLVSLMSNMSMPSSFFALCILTLWGAFWGGLLHFQGGSLVSPVG